MGIWLIDLPFIKIFPLSALSAPIAILNRVLFPAPFGPSKPTISPGKTFNESFFRIGLPSKDLVTSLTSNIGLSFLNFKILNPFFFLILH